MREQWSGNANLDKVKYYFICIYLNILQFRLRIYVVETQKPSKTYRKRFVQAQDNKIERDFIK